MNQATAAPQTRIVAKRIVLLLALLVLELLAVYLLRSRGWLATGNLIQWLLAAAVALLPIVAAAVILLARGRRFSLRSMMIATALLAVFIALILYPYTRARERRRGVSFLNSQRIPFEIESPLRDVYARFGIAYRQEPESATRSSEDLAFWMKPLIEDSMPTYSDRAVRVLDLRSDEDVAIANEVIGGFSNLEEVRVSYPGVTTEGLQYLAENYPALDSLSVAGDISIPDDWGRSLRGVRYLGLTRHLRRKSLTESQVKDILSIRGLEVLRLDRFDIDERDAALLAQPSRLKRLILWRSGISEAAHATIRTLRPDLKLRVGPDLLSPESFYFMMSDAAEAEITVVYNEQRTRWGRRRASREPNVMSEFGDGSELIDTEYPIEVQIRAPDEQDTKFIHSTLRALRYISRFANVIPSQVDQRTFTASITFVEKPPSAAR